MLKKNIKPVLLAGALALATAVSPVMATEISNIYSGSGYTEVENDDGTKTKTNISSDTVNVKKILKVDDNLNNLNENLAFNFTVSNADALGANDPQAGTGTAPVVKVGNEVKNTGTVTFTDLTTSPDALAFTFVPVQPINDSAGTTPGNYYYTLEESSVSQTDDVNYTVDYSGAKYTIIVQVQNDLDNGGVKVDHLVIKDFNDGSKGDAEFENIYNEFGTLKVEKQVTGAAAKADSFDFVIDLTLSDNYALTLGENETSITFRGCLATENVASDQFTNTAITFTKDTSSGKYTAQLTGKLADDGVVTITGLPVGTQFKVSEKDTDYVESATLNTTEYSLNNEQINNVKYWCVSGNIIDSDDNENINYVKFTNTRSPLTGVIINNMPYIALLGASGAGLVVLAASKKRSK